MSSELTNHPDKTFCTYLISGLSNGFDIFLDEEKIQSSKECKNLKSSKDEPEIVDSLIQNELEKGFVIGPFSEPPFQLYRISPVGIAIGKYSGKKRLILDLSSPHNDPNHESINNLIDKEKCSLTYVKIDDAIKHIQEFGRGTILCKTDIQDAFKQIPVTPEQWRFLGFKWNNNYYFSVRLPFGSRSSPKIFDNLSQAVCWIAKHNYGIHTILHLLDDFLTIDRPSADGERTMLILKMIFKRLGIPLSEKKTEGPATCLTYLGIILDTDKMQAILPDDKVQRIAHYIQELLGKKTCTKLELLQLLGHFNFATRVILPGRAFMSYLISLSTTVKELHYFVHLNQECRNDLKMWLTFLADWNGITLFYDRFLSSNADLQLFTDAASNSGFGGYFDGEWFSEPWPEDLMRHTDGNMSMAFMELYPIVVAAILWGNVWKGKRIQFMCDNEAVVNIIQKGRSKETYIMKLMRRLVMCSVQNNFVIYSKHVPGVFNEIADALSRFQFQRFRNLAPHAETKPNTCPPIQDVLWESMLL
jgi:hypothetical protein